MYPSVQLKTVGGTTPVTLKACDIGLVAAYVFPTTPYFDFFRARFSAILVNGNNTN